MMMMMMMMMMNCFCVMVDRRNVVSLISSQDYCQKFSPSRISDTPGAWFEPLQNLSSNFLEWGCAVVITTTPRRHYAITSVIQRTSREHLYHELSLESFRYRQWCRKLTFFFIKLWMDLPQSTLLNI